MGRKRLKKAYREKNARRIDLLRQPERTPAEAAELAALEAWVGAEVDRVYPIDFPVLDRLQA